MKRSTSAARACLDATGQDPYAALALAVKLIHDGRLRHTRAGLRWVRR